MTPLAHLQYCLGFGEHSRALLLKGLYLMQPHWSSKSAPAYLVGLCCRRDSIFSPHLHRGYYLPLWKKKKIHHVGTKPQYFCIPSNLAPHTADKQVLFWRRTIWKGRGNQWVEIEVFVALQTWKSLGNRQTIDFPASSQLCWLNRNPHAV